MKKLLAALVISFLLATVPHFAVQEQEQETVQESVKVVNVEVPVRVFYKGKPVDNLTRDDFKLYEDGKLQEINGFIIKRNKIKFQEIGLQVEEKKTYLPRYFVLVFRVTEYNKSMKQGLAHVFDNILREQDELRVFVNNKALYFAKLSAKQDCQQKIDRVLMGESKTARQRLQTYLKNLEQQVDMTKFKMLLRDSSRGGSSPSQERKMYLKQFFQRYLQIWREFKKRYLIPDLDHYYNFAKHLEGIKKEKWVINFYQMELFPQISISGEARRIIKDFITEMRLSANPDDKAFARILDKMLQDIDRELNVVNEFPTEAISKIFYKVGATFHSIFMRSTLRIVSRDYNYKRVSSDIENSLREITKTTGGTLVATNNLEKAMDTIQEKENVYYLLTYAPDDPDKNGKLKIKVNKKKHKVIYDDNMRADYLQNYIAKREADAPAAVAAGGPSVRITKLEFKNNKLIIAADGFRTRRTSKGGSGKMGIRIQVKNIQGLPIFDQSKALALKKDDVSITIPFNLKRGRYDIIVDVKDLTTGKSDTKVIKARIK